MIKLAIIIQSTNLRSQEWR